MTTYDNLWQLLTAYDSLWQLLTTFDNFWQLLTTFDNFWHLLTTFVNFWHLLTTFDNFWELLTTFNNFWQLLTTFYNLYLYPLETEQLPSPRRRAHFFSVQTIFYWPNLAKPNHTIPHQDILGPFIGLFDPFLGQKYQKPIVKDFKEFIGVKPQYFYKSGWGQIFWYYFFDWYPPQRS